MRCRRTWIVVALLSAPTPSSGSSRSVPSLAGRKYSVAARRKKSSPSRHARHVDVGADGGRRELDATAPRGGASEVAVDAPPSMYWAVLHNWLYFLSLGFNLINIQFLVRDIVEWLKIINEC